MRPAGSAENDAAKVAIAVPPRFGDAHHPKQSKRKSEKKRLLPQPRRARYEAASPCCVAASVAKDGIGSKAAFFARGGGRSGSRNCAASGEEAGDKWIVVEGDVFWTRPGGPGGRVRAL